MNVSVRCQFLTSSERPYEAFVDRTGKTVEGGVNRRVTVLGDDLEVYSLRCDPDVFAQFSGLAAGTDVLLVCDAYSFQKRVLLGSVRQVVK